MKVNWKVAMFAAAEDLNNALRDCQGRRQIPGLATASNDQSGNRGSCSKEVMCVQGV